MYEEDDSGYSVTEIIYMPILMLDRKVWHTKDRAKSMKYPIRYYYDEENHEYRDYKPQ